MNQRIINVILVENETGNDVLRFILPDEMVLEINLNTETCQTQIKTVFESILRISIDEDVHLVFRADDSYTKQLYIDVCSEYIKEIQNEIDKSTAQMRLELS